MLCGFVALLIVIFRIHLVINQTCWPANIRMEIFSVVLEYLQLLASSAAMLAINCVVASVQTERSQCFHVHVFSVHRQWYNEQETDLGQRAGSARPPGLAVQEERKQRFSGY